MIYSSRQNYVFFNFFSTLKDICSAFNYRTGKKKNDYKGMRGTLEAQNLNSHFTVDKRDIKASSDKIRFVIMLNK